MSPEFNAKLSGEGSDPGCEPIVGPGGGGHSGGVVVDQHEGFECHISGVS